MSQPFLGRCKHCDYAVFATEEDIQPATGYRDVLAGGVYRLERGRVLGRCTNGHRVFPLRRIKGTYSESFKCDSRCLNAKGHDCTCSCGGANHGRGHAVQVVPVAVTARASYPKDDPNWDIERHEREQREFASPAKPIERHLGEVGRHIKGNVRLIRKHIREGGSHPTIYTFITLDETARIVWFAPYYADPEINEGEVFSIRAKVKRHENDPTYGKTTVVTYVEGPAGQPLQPKKEV